MAFAYSDQSASDDPLKQNIFGGNTAQAQGQQQPGTDTPQKTSIDGGEVVSGSMTQTSGQQPSAGQSQPKVQQSYNPKNVQNAYGQIAKRLSLPEQRLQNARSSISDASQRLQDEANRYGQSAQAAISGYNLDDDTVKKAVSGDTEAYKKTASRLQETAPQFESFKGLGSDIPNVDYLRNTQNIYAENAGPNYSSGQRRLDSALLRMNPNYGNNVEQILADQQALAKRNDELIENETRARREDVARGHGEALADIKRRLGLLGDEIITGAKGRETAEDTRRGGLDAGSIGARETQKLKDRIRQDLSVADPRSQQYRSLKFLDSIPLDDLSKYVSINGDTRWTDFITDEDAAKYNRAMGLMGSENSLQKGTGPAADYSFNEGDAYRDALARLIGKRQEVDRTDQEEIDRIRNEATARVQGYNLSDAERDPIVSARKELLDWARGRASATSNGDPGEELKAQMSIDQLFNDPAEIQKMKDAGIIRDNPGTAAWTDALLDPEAARLNELTEDLGGLEKYSAGGYKPEYDLRDLRNYYGEFMKRWKMPDGVAVSEPPTPPPPGPSIVPVKGEEGYALFTPDDLNEAYVFDPKRFREMLASDRVSAEDKAYWSSRNPVSADLPEGWLKDRHLDDAEMNDMFIGNLSKQNPSLFERVVSDPSLAGIMDNPTHWKSELDRIRNEKLAQSAVQNTPAAQSASQGQQGTTKKDDGTYEVSVNIPGTGETKVINVGTPQKLSERYSDAELNEMKVFDPARYIQTTGQRPVSYDLMTSPRSENWLNDRQLSDAEMNDLFENNKPMFQRVMEDPSLVQIIGGSDPRKIEYWLQRYKALGPSPSRQEYKAKGLAQQSPYRNRGD